MATSVIGAFAPDSRVGWLERSLRNYYGCFVKVSTIFHLRDVCSSAGRRVGLLNSHSGCLPRTNAPAAHPMPIATTARFALLIWRLPERPET